MQRSWIRRPCPPDSLDRPGNSEHCVGRSPTANPNSVLIQSLAPTLFPRSDGLPVGRRRTKCVLLGALIVLAGLVGVAPAALAAPPPWSNSRHNRGHYDGYDYAPVTSTSSRSFVRCVSKRPRRECWDETRYVESRPAHLRSALSAVAPLLGGIIGGVIGHQFGSGRGQDAATIAVR